MAEPSEPLDEAQAEATAAQPADQTAATVAMALGQASHDKAVNAETAAYLRDQRRLIGLQTEHLHEQRELVLSRLRWGRFSDRMKAALQLMTALVALVIAVGIGGAIWDAVHADSVVVDAFHAPPAMAGRGIDGTVVASRLLDELQRLQTATRTEASKRGVKDAWSGDIKVEVPETGVSVGEAVRFLHAWLGHETHVGGDLEQTDAGLKLSVRGDGFEARSFEGGPGDLPKLTTQAAEYVYSQSEPYLAASYFFTHGRDAEAIALVEAKYAGAKASDRPFLLNAWGNGLLDLGRSAEALPKFQEAIRLNPSYWVAHNNVMAVLWSLGREEDSWRAGKLAERTSGRGRPGQKAPEIYFQNLDTQTWNLGAERAALIADTEAHGGQGSGLTQNGTLTADAAMRMHDPAAAELFLQTTPDAQKDPFSAAMIHFVHGWGALDRGDWARADAELGSFAAAYANPTVNTEVPGYVCWAAPAAEMAGHPDRAEAALKAGGRFVDCWRFRADILDHRGDWPAAQKAYADAVALAPDLPAPWYSWGLALARHGDLAGAEAKYAAASVRGPHWADPLKAWGDALAAQHRFAEAETKYAEAVKFAPKWLALRLAYGNALRAEGKFREAIAQFRAVTG